MQHDIGIIMNGVTGRMGTNQHLLRSIDAIRKEGGLKIGENEVIMPDPILVGRNEAKLQKLCSMTGIGKMTTFLQEALADPHNTIYFDAQITGRRHESVKQAIEAGKHIYCEKPSGTSTAEAIDLYHIAEKAGKQLSMNLRFAMFFSGKQCVLKILSNIIFEQQWECLLSL